MFGAIALVASIFVIYLSINVLFQISIHRKIMLESGITSIKITFLQLSCLLYIVSLLGFSLPSPWLDLIRPIPIGFIILIPGIILGNKISTSLGRAGVDKAVNAGRVANNAMWLGIGTGIFIGTYTGLELVIYSVGSEIPY